MSPGWMQMGQGSAGEVLGPPGKVWGFQGRFGDTQEWLWGHFGGTLRPEEPNGVLGHFRAS